MTDKRPKHAAPQDSDPKDDYQAKHREPVQPAESRHLGTRLDRPHHPDGWFADR